MSFVILEFFATIPIFLSPVVVIVPLFIAFLAGLVTVEGSVEYIPVADFPLTVIFPSFVVLASEPTIPKALFPSIVIDLLRLLVPSAPSEA